MKDGFYLPAPTEILKTFLNSLSEYLPTAENYVSHEDIKEAFKEFIEDNKILKKYITITK